MHSALRYWIYFRPSTSGVSKRDLSVNNELKAGIRYKTLLFACRMTSSDVGLSGADIYPYLNIDGQKRVIGKPICLEHKGDASLRKFGENVEMIFSLFKESEEALAKLERKKISHPSGAFKRVAKQIGLPKRSSIEKADEFRRLFMNPTWLDLYWNIYEERNT